MAEQKSKGRILVVEDETFMRELYEELLKGDGYEVNAAPDGAAALTLIADKKYDLTMLDIMLPKKDGLQVIEEAAEAGQSDRLGKVILLTNLGQEAVIKRGFELGAVGYLIKSAYTPQQVLDEVATFLGNGGNDEGQAK